jgi:Flp pilus assembly protein TadD
MPHLTRLGVALSALISLGLAVVGAAEQGDAIRAALRARDFEAAFERSRSALQRTPDDPQLWTLQGMALTGLGKRAEALQSFQRALKIDPNYLAALEGAAQLHFDADSRRAVPLLNRILRLRPEDPTAHAMLAVLQYRDGSCRAAVPHFEKAGALLDSQLDALHAHATCLVRLQQPAAAIGVLQRTVALQPENPRERKLLAAVQLMAEKPQDAIATLSPLTEGPQPDAETLGLASAAYEKSGDTPHAVATLRQAILLDPKNIDLYLDFANIAFAHKTVFMGPDADYNPFHTNNFSAAVGGPIIPKKQLFFFFAFEPLRSSASTGNQTIFFPDQQFAQWAQQNYPNTFGTKILNTYVPSGASVSGVSKTAADIFPTTCGTPATNNLPCSLPMIDSGIFNSSSFRDGDQYFLRVDKHFANDRIYGSFFRTLLDYGGPNVIPQFSTTNHNTQYAIQVNYTRVFGPNTLNEAIFASNRIEGFIGETGDFTIPNITVTGLSTPYGVGFAQGNFIQHNYQWRDVLTHVRGPHVLKFGYEGWFGDDVEPFQGPYSQPDSAFDNPLKLAQDAPHTQGGVMYDPLTGQQRLWEWNAASRTWGAFVQDTWKARRNLTLTLGFRYDDQGNPWSRSDTTVFGNFYPGQGATVQEQIANGVARASDKALKRSPKAFNPRAGVAWDGTGDASSRKQGLQGLS